MSARIAQHPRRALRRKEAVERQEKTQAKSLEERINEQLQFNPGVAVDLKTNTITSGVGKKELKKLLNLRASIQVHLKEVKAEGLVDKKNKKTDKIGKKQVDLATYLTTVATGINRPGSMSALRMLVSSKRVALNGKTLTDISELKLNVKSGDVIVVGTNTTTVE